MDSLTHITLSACVGEAMLGRPLGKKAMLWGALAQSLPDVDGLAALWLDPASNLLIHRGLTHSLPVGWLAAVGLAWATYRRTRFPFLAYRQWLLFWAVQLSLHDLLDTANAYGTGLLEPFSHQRFSVHLLYVADPFFTLPLLVACGLLVLMSRRHRGRPRWAVSALVVSLGYAGYAYANKMNAEKGIRQSLALQPIKSTGYVVTPTPFNTWLWYAVVATDKGYYVGYRSVFEPRNVPTPFTYFPRRVELLTATNDSVAVSQLVRFANGYYTVERGNGTGTSDSLRINVLRFGQVMGWQQPTAPFAFQYGLGPHVDNRLVMQRGRVRGWNAGTLRRLYKRIVNVHQPVSATAP